MKKKRRIQTREQILERKASTKSKTKFVLPDTLSLPKHFSTDTGELVVDINNRTMRNKAFKAYKRGDFFYKYKGKTYAVPMVPVEDLLNHNEEE